MADVYTTKALAKHNPWYALSNEHFTQSRFPSSELDLHPFNDVKERNRDFGTDPYQASPTKAFHQHLISEFDILCIREADLCSTSVPSKKGINSKPTLETTMS